MLPVQPPPPPLPLLSATNEAPTKSLFFCRERDRKRFTPAEFHLPLCAYEDARVAYQAARPQRTQVFITRPAVSEPVSANDPWFGGVFFRSARQESAQSVYTFFETLAELDTTICMRVERIAKTRC